MGTVRRLESWPFSYFSASLAVHIMLIMSGEGSDALRLIRLKFYGTLAGTSEANTSFPNQALINSRKWFFTLKEPENPHTVRVSKKKGSERFETLYALGLPTIAQLPGLERHLTSSRVPLSNMIDAG